MFSVFCCCFICVFEEILKNPTKKCWQMNEFDDRLMIFVEDDFLHCWLNIISMGTSQYLYIPSHVNLQQIIHLDDSDLQTLIWSRIITIHDNCGNLYKSFLHRQKKTYKEMTKLNFTNVMIQTYKRLTWILAWKRTI